MPRRNPGPSVKDDEQYEALRSAVGRRGGRSPSYDQWSRDDLYQRARELNVMGRSSMTKSDLIDALRNH